MKNLNKVTNHTSLKFSLILSKKCTKELQTVDEVNELTINIYVFL